MASYSYRTATTIYPCYVPVLGDSKGAGRMRLAAANVTLHFELQWKKTSILQIHKRYIPNYKEKP